LKKRGREERRAGVKLDYEYEYEREDDRKREANVIENGAKRRALSKSTASSGTGVDF